MTTAQTQISHLAVLSGLAGTEMKVAAKERTISSASNITAASSAASVSNGPSDTGCSSLLQTHIFSKIKQSLGPKKTMVIGHRGGFLDGPENSMRAFKAAIAHKIEGVEFDNIFVNCFSCINVFTNN